MSQSLYISAAHKSSGKTVITTGLARALVERGNSVQGFKKGPDYIDPLWLASATARPCWNLDFNTQTDTEIRSLLHSRSHEASITLIEGNKGLHDGTAVDGSNSNAAMAKLLDGPVVLVVDTRGMTRGVAPLVQGMQAFDPDVQLAGVILNQVGGSRHEGKLRSVLEAYTDIPVLGSVHKNPGLIIDERDLGLIPSNEAQDAEAFITHAAKAAREQIDLDRLLACAKPLPETLPPSISPQGNRKVTIAIARDEAFGFYYADDLEAFEQAGAECVFFDTLSDTRLPPCDGLFIGGGFPETRLEALSGNAALKTSIRRAVEHGLPAYAECGGLMYLSDSIHWNDRSAPMVGVIPGQTEMCPRPVGRGYVRLAESAEHPWHTGDDEDISAGILNAHEFHHSRLRLSGSDHRFAYTVKRGHGIDGDNDGIVVHNLLANYAHLRSTQSNHWVERFVRFIRKTAIHWNPDR